MRLASSGCRTAFPLGRVGTSCAWGAYVTRHDDHAQYFVSQEISYCRDTLLSTPHVASFGSNSPVAATFARPLRAFRRWLLRPLRPDFLDIKPSGLVTGPRRRPSSLLVSLRCPIGHSVDIANENWTSGMRTYNICRDAGKIDKTRLPTSTELRRVAGACQSSLQKSSSETSSAKARHCRAVYGAR